MVQVSLTYYLGMGQKTEMVFITIRDDYIPTQDEGGMERLAQNYQ